MAGPRLRPRILLPAALAFVSGFAAAQELAGFEDFAADYCLACHDTEKAKGDVDFESARFSIESPADAERWELVRLVLELGEMPPHDAPRRPDDAERSAQTAALADALAAWSATSNRGAGRTGLRQLTSTEFANAVQDLFGMPLSREMRDRLPQDEELENFDVIAEAQRMTRDRISTSLDAAIEITAGCFAWLEANAHPEQKWVPGDDNPWELRGTNVAIDSKEENGPRTERMRLILAALNRGRELDPDEIMSAPMEREPLAIGLRDSYVGVRRSRYQFHEKGLAAMTCASRTIAVRPPATECGTPNVVIGGRYRYRVRAGSIRDPEGKLMIRVGIRSKRAFRKESCLPHVRTLARCDAPPIEQPADLEGTVWIAPGERLVVQMISRTPKFHRLREEDVLASRMPGLVVEAIDLELLRDEDVATLREGLFGPTGARRETRREPLRELLRRAFRRPIDDELLELFDTNYPQAEVDAGRSTHRAAVADLVGSVLASPWFLFVREPEDPDDPFAWAERAALFLWRSLPAPELLDLAEAGALDEPAGRRAALARLLEDPRSERFEHDFLDQWLELDKLGLMEPDLSVYPEWSEDLERSLREQTRGYFQRMLALDRPLTEFLDSDWTLLNETLCQHYGVPGSVRPAVAPVDLAPEHRIRGGLLGMGSLMNLTTNGTATSPVLRGVWVLQSLLHRFPDPPPADVEPIEPDIRGTTTILEQLAKHSEVASCATCHRSIDPFGTALETLDVVGLERAHYRRVEVRELEGARGSTEKAFLVDGAPVSAGTTLPDGTFVDGLAGLKRWFVEHDELFARALTAKLMTFAEGRSMTGADQKRVDSVLRAAGGPRAGLRSLVETVLVGL